MATLLGNISLLEWIGYLASVIIAVSMAFNSIVKFRITNLLGAALFSAYGFIIGAIPVGILNAFIVAVDLYYLILIFGKKERFELLQIEANNAYLHKFISFHAGDIRKFFPDFQLNPTNDSVQFLMLRNMSVAGVFIGIKQGSKLEITLDYVVPEYRDFKSGKFLIKHLQPFFRQQGIEKLQASTQSKKHAAYLLRMGYHLAEANRFVKSVDK